MKASQTVPVFTSRSHQLTPCPFVSSRQDNNIKSNISRAGHITTLRMDYNLTMDGWADNWTEPNMTEHALADTVAATEFILEEMWTVWRILVNSLTHIFLAR